MTDEGSVFPIRYSRLGLALVLCGLTPARSRVVLGPDAIEVRMGWAFRMRAPRTAVRSAARDHGLLLDRGVHGWFGRWNVAASGRGLVRIAFDPPVAARTGPFRVRVRRLRVSLVEPEAFLSELGAPAA